MRKFLVTVDTDWAPEWCIQWLLDELLNFEYHPIIFFTNSSEIPIRYRGKIEVGIHPDFSRKNFEESVSNFKQLKKMFPDAIISRSHRNVFGQHIARLLIENNIKFDVSTLLFNIKTSNWTDSRGLRRISYSFEDGVYLDELVKNPNIKINFQEERPTIVNLHPVLLYLNSINDTNRRSFTSRYSDLTKVPRDIFDEFSNKSELGIRDFVWHLLSMGQQSEKSIYEQ